MKVFFDTNVYVAEALLGSVAERLIAATLIASWRVYCTAYVLEELQRVLCERLGCSYRFARLTSKRVARRAALVAPSASRHVVPDDLDDSPILRAALAAGVDYLVSNDAHFLALSPYESLRILSMAEYFQLLDAHGHLS